MSFGENLSYYRKKAKITQEELADSLFVTRQTVSRWETDVALPDLETIIKICDTLGCDMDTLVRGNASIDDNKKPIDLNENVYCNLNDYDKHMNKFSLSISLGVGIIILGVSLMLLLLSFQKEILGVVSLLVFVGVAVADFIIAGTNHSNFMKNNPKAPNYPIEQKQKFMKKFAFSIAGATLFIFLAVILLILITAKIDDTHSNSDQMELLAVSIFIFLISFSVFTYTFSGMRYFKYEVEKYNQTCIEEGFAQDDGERLQNTPKHIKIEETASSIIMTSATLIFLLLGFIANLWHPAWVVFPIGGVLCGIASIIINALSKK